MERTTRYGSSLAHRSGSGADEQGDLRGAPFRGLSLLAFCRILVTPPRCYAPLESPAQTKPVTPPEQNRADRHADDRQCEQTENHGPTILKRESTADEKERKL